MKVLSFVLLSFCLLCGAGAWRSFEAPDSRQALGRAMVALDRVADNPGDRDTLARVRQEYWVARDRVNRFEEIARGCFMAAFCFGLGSMIVLAYGEKVSREPLPVALPAVAEIAEPLAWKSPTSGPAVGARPEPSPERHAVGAQDEATLHDKPGR